MATQTKTRKPDTNYVTTQWDGVTAPEITIPQDDYQWTLKVVVDGISTSVDFVGNIPKPKN